MSLRARILLLVLLATLTPTLVVGLREVNRHDSEIDKAGHNLGALAKYAAAGLDDKVKGTVQLLHGLSRAPDLETPDKAACAEFLAGVLARYPQYTGLLTITPEGDLHCDSLRSGRQLNVSTREYFRQVSATREPAFDVVIGGLTGIAVLQVAYPVLDERGAIKYVLLASLNLSQYAQDFAAASYYPDVSILIWNRNGMLMARKPETGGPSLVGKEFAAAELFLFAAATDAGAAAELPGVDGVPRVWARSALREPGGGGARITLGIPRAVLTAEANKGLRDSLLLLIGVALLAFTGAWFVAELSIRRPAARIIRVAARLEAGDLGARIGAPQPRGELGDLMTAIDRTAAAVQTQQAEIEARSRDLRHANRTLRVLSGINTLIVRVRDREELFNEACRIAVAEGGFSMAWIGIVDMTTMKISVVAAAGGDAEILSAIKERHALEGSVIPGNTLSAQAIREKHAVVTNDLLGDFRITFRDKHVKAGNRSMAILPLIVADQGVGVIALYAGETGIFDGAELKLLTELAGDIAFALDHIEKQEQLEYLAYYDALTGLANRGLFHNRLAQSLHVRSGEQPLIATVLLDLERFRRVNETMGRRAGDELLRDIGARLLRANDTAARIGGDMFGLILRGARTVAEVNRALEAIVVACFTEPFAHGDEELRVACRAGVAVYPGDGADADALLRNAEAALRRSKRSSDRIVFYSREMNARVAEALAIETRLRRAIERGEFVLHYQPKISLATGRITGMEALIRWQDSVRGLVPPVQFIPVLEETGMIVEVGRWVVEQAFADRRAWLGRGLDVPRVAVNVSAIQLQRTDFVDNMVAEIRRGGSPECLELEITESMVMGNVEDSIRKLSILRGLGVTVAIDDFGTGYSSLSYLGKLPLDALKIDRSFVSGMASSAEAESIVSTIVALAHSLKLKVVAEGVETEEQSGMLKLLGCDEAQGYLFSKPVPAEILEARFLTRDGAGRLGADVAA
jgi:diguanylate cyclase (GGDEF)-like protein